MNWKRLQENSMYLSKRESPLNRPQEPERVQQFARDLKKKATRSEKRYKALLDLLTVKYKFQYLLCPGKKWYIVDFYLPEYRIAIEIDGGYHSTPTQKRRDNIRTSQLKNIGVKVIRFTNEETLNYDFIKDRTCEILLNSKKVDKTSTKLAKQPRKRRRKRKRQLKA